MNFKVSYIFEDIYETFDSKTRSFFIDNTCDPALLFGFGYHLLYNNMHIY